MTMVATIRSGLFTSLLLALFLGLVAVPRGAQSFVPSYGRSNTYNTFPLASTTDDDVALDGETSAEDTPPPQPVKCPDCDLCDGSGRIEGGIGVVLKFWPIKAYRPCPNFIANGGFYTRSGQGLDEIAFGRDSKYDPME
mmetsp:Transcript_19832/g.45246  ORF Transcript_19832/g.45246 Transcript_19832/m.45246 type:complete len:139 (+) Transcript_19832:157-573(+)